MMKMKKLPALTAAILCAINPACKEQAPTPPPKTEQAPPLAEVAEAEKPPGKPPEKPKSLNVDVVGKAWAAYGKKDYQAAIAVTDMRLASFKNVATSIQERLTNSAYLRAGKTRGPVASRR